MNERDYYDAYMSENQEHLVESEAIHESVEKISLEERISNFKSDLSVLMQLREIGEDTTEALTILKDTNKDIIPQMIESGELDQESIELLQLDDIEQAYEENSTHDNTVESSGFTSQQVRDAIGDIPVFDTCERIDRIEAELLKIKEQVSELNQPTEKQI